MKPAVLEELARMHQSEIFRYVRYMGASREVAEDVVQDAFLAAFRSASHPDMENVRLRAAWLRGVARNVFLNYCRRVRSSPVKVDSDSLEQAEGTWVREFLRKGDGFEYIEALRKCVESLSEKQRRMVDMRYAEKKSRSTMAGMLNMTGNGVKSVLRRIRAALAACVEKRFTSGA